VQRRPDACQPSHPLTARLCPCVAAATVAGAAGEACDAACARVGRACRDDVLRAFDAAACLSPLRAKRYTVRPSATRPDPARLAALPAIVDGACLTAAPDAKHHLACAAAHPEHARLCPCA
jgi:hypothetical protein